MGYLTAANLAPFLLFSLHAGAWIDRSARRRRLMVAADVGRALVLASVPIAYAIGDLTLAQLYVVAFVAGTLTTFFFVAQTTLFIALVPREGYVQASALLHGSRAFSFVAGPSVAGGLVQLLTAPYALVADACSFLVSAFSLRRIEAPEPPAAPPEAGHLTAGARYIRGSATVGSMLASTATLNFFNFAFSALFILYATRALHVRPGLLGVVLGAGAIGGLAGSALTPRLSRRLGVGPAYTLGMILFPAPLILVPLAGGPKPLVLAMLFLAEFGSGFGVMMLDISAGAIFAAVIPSRLRARVSGAYLVVNNGIRPLGALFGGTLGSAIGVRPTLWIATAAALAGALWLVPSPVPRIRELPDVAEG